MNTKEVASDDGLELRDEGDHGVGPMEHWSQSEMQSVSADVELTDAIATASNHGVGKGPIPNEADVAQTRAGCNDLCIWKTVDNKSKASTVVWFGVVQDNVINLLIWFQNGIKLLFIFYQ